MSFLLDKTAKRSVSVSSELVSYMRDSTVAFKVRIIWPYVRWVHKTQLKLTFGALLTCVVTSLQLGKLSS